MTVDRSSVPLVFARHLFTRLAIAPLVIALGSSVACTRDAPAPEQAHQAAPEFEIKTLDGDDDSLAAYRGQVVLLNVWATWCDPCVRELPELVRLHEAYASKGFTVIGLNTDVRAKISAVRAMVVRNRLPYPVWLDFESRSQVTFELRGYPTSILIDREGKVRWRREGEILRNDPELMPVLEAVLAEGS